MKKNAMLKIAAVLLVAVLLTTCAISSTFAKYVATPSTTSASARVAKWGITVTNSVTTPGFKDAYADGSGTVVKAGEAVVAPGTQGKVVIQSVISGVNNTEVDVDIKHTWNVQYGSAFEDYDPMEFVVSSTDQDLAAVDWSSSVKGLANLKDALADVLAEDLTTIDAAVTADKTETVCIYWRWDFGNGSTDADDTTLGKAAVSGDTTDFTITLTTTAVQGGANYAE